MEDNRSRNSQDNFIRFLNKITCGAFHSIIKDRPSQGFDCFPFLVVSREQPIERDGWERGEVWDTERQAIRTEVDIYITYRLKDYGEGAEMLLLDVQQLFLRHDVMELLELMVGGRLIRTGDVRTLNTRFSTEFVDSAFLDVRLGFVDVVYHESVENCDSLQDSYPLEDMEADGLLYEHTEDTSPLPVHIFTNKGE
jgi:hypothetical protein